MIFVVNPLGFVVSRRSEHLKSTWTNVTAAAIHVVRQPVRMRCLELCLHNADCQAVAYKTSSEDAENCAHYDQDLAEETLIYNSEWNVISLMEF